MAKEKTTGKATGKQRLINLAKSKPVLPVISDHPLTNETADKDIFDLCYRLGPVFDILRHKDTRTPTTIAIYGDWGTGKTSSMQWLESLIQEWNKNVLDGHKRLDTIWFCPWKYHDKEDVWRGLIAEVIKKSIDIKGADIGRIKKAVKQFGLFLGKSFVHLLSNVTLKAGVQGVGEAEVDLASVREIVEEYQKNIHPEKGFLNEFEDLLEEWIKDTISSDKRLVIFIDDLDRCMPEVALQVLEALKLYLNIEGLIFVVGVDRDVINPLVKKHYETLGLAEYKSDNYLAKMFQTEVVVGPSEKQIDEYLEQHIDNIEYFGPNYLEPWQKELFCKLIHKLADRNPREIKRLINSAVMAGAGAEMMKKAGGEDGGVTFVQGLQVFFIRRILEQDKYEKPEYERSMQRILGSKIGNEFFSKWSKIVRDGRNNNSDFPLNVSEELLNELSDIPSNHESLELVEREEEIFSNIPKIYHDLLLHYPVFYNPLLSDEDLGELMRIEYSAESGIIAATIQQVETKEQAGTLTDSDQILEVIADRLKKLAEKLTEKDLPQITELDLSDKDISDISILSSLTNLSVLILSKTQVSNIYPLSGLTNLSILDLGKTQVSDISPLSGLMNLSKLNLGRTRVSDISSLSGLTKLSYLDLRNTQVSDIRSLSSLTDLSELDLYNTQLLDISPLFSLTKLSDLNIRGNKNISREQVVQLKKRLSTCQIHSDFDKQ